MDTDQKIRVALGFEPDTEPSFELDFDVFRTRARRATIGHAATTVVAVVLPLALLVGALAWVARGNSTSAFAGNPDILTGELIVDEKVGYAFRIPEGWDYAQYDLPDAYSVHRVAGPQSRLLMYLSAYQYRDFEDYADAHDDDLVDNFDRARSTSGTIGGRRARAVEARAPDGHVYRTYFVEWTNTWVLEIRMDVPASERVWLDEAVAVVASVSPIEVAAVTTSHGTAAASVPVDDATLGLIEFLEARVAGKGAERYLSRAAADEYAEFDGAFNLYDMVWIDASSGDCTTEQTENSTSMECTAGSISGDGSNAGTEMHARFYRYEVTSRRERDDRYVYEVDMVSEGDEVYERYDTEQIVVRLEEGAPGGIVVVSASHQGNGGIYKG